MTRVVVVVVGFARADFIGVDILERDVDVDFIDIAVLDSVSEGEAERLVLLLTDLYIKPIQKMSS